MEMHDYQEEYLSKKAVDHNLDSGGAFRALLTHAATDPSNWGDIFRTVHCLRCDNLPDNLSTADNAWKKSKKPVRFGLQPDHTAFLEARVANEEGVDIAEEGPVNRAVLDTGKAQPVATLSHKAFEGKALKNSKNFTGVALVAFLCA